MKPQLKSTSPVSFRLLAVISSFVLILTGCGNQPQTNGIPVDEARAAGQVIPVQEGISFQNNFIAARKELKAQLKDTSFLDKKFRLPNAETFNRDAIGLLLNAPGADGIRVYMASDTAGELKFVLVPVDKNGKDIITRLLTNKTALHIPGISTAQAQEGDGGQVVENGQICPPCQIGGR